MNLSNNMQSSNKWLYILLFVAVMLTIWTALQNDTDVELNAVELTERPASTGIEKLSSLKTSQKDVVNEKDVSDWAIPWHKLKREPLTVKSSNLFNVHSWEVIPPVKKIKPAPPPPPVAPPVPFTYLGKLEDSPKNTQIFLMANGRLFSIKLGENIDQQWRLDIEDANTVRLTYLPLNLPQVLSKNARPVITPADALPVAENNQ